MCVELSGMDEKGDEHIRVRIKERTGKGDVILGSCHRPPH